MVLNMNERQQKWLENYINTPSLKEAFEIELALQDEIILDLINEKFEHDRERLIQFTNDKINVYPDKALKVIKNKVVKEVFIEAICLNRDVKSGSQLIRTRYNFKVESVVSCGAYKTLVFGEEIESNTDMKNVGYDVEVAYVLIKDKECSPVIGIERLGFSKISLVS
jgi:hypothetical protein